MLHILQIHLELEDGAVVIRRLAVFREQELDALSTRCIVCVAGRPWKSCRIYGRFFTNVTWKKRKNSEQNQPGIVFSNLIRQFWSADCSVFRARSKMNQSSFGMVYIGGLKMLSAHTIKMHRQGWWMRQAVSNEVLNEMRPRSEVVYD